METGPVNRLQAERARIPFANVGQRQPAWVKVEVQPS